MVSPQRDRRRGEELITCEVIDDRFGLGATIHVVGDQNRHAKGDRLSGKVLGDKVANLDEKISASVHVANDVDPGPRSDASPGTASRTVPQSVGRDRPRIPGRQDRENSFPQQSRHLTDICHCTNQTATKLFLCHSRPSACSHLSRRVPSDFIH